MKHRGNPGLRGRLLNKSVDVYILSLETINRLSIQYRLEAFCYLICNAWELLLKAKILADTNNNHDAIYRGKKKRGVRRESLSLRECLERVIPVATDPERRNIEKIADLRDEATHLVISKIPGEILLLFQACVINFHERLNHWFNISISDLIPAGMMSIVYDIQPLQFDMSDRQMRRILGSDAANFLLQFCTDIKKEYEDLNCPQKFSIDLKYHLVLTKKEDNADITLSKGPGGKQFSGFIEVPKDPSKSHPFRQIEVIQKINETLSISINHYDIQCINKLYNIKENPLYFYKGTIKGSPTQYSQTFIDWILNKYQNDSSFFNKTREKIAKQKK